MVKARVFAFYSERERERGVFESFKWESEANGALLWGKRWKCHCDCMLRENGAPCSAWGALHKTRIIIHVFIYFLNFASNFFIFLVKKFG